MSGHRSVGTSSRSSDSDSSQNVKHSCSDINTKGIQQIIKSLAESNKDMDGNLRRIPVFVFPTSLNFYLNARHTHKQLLTLYNPYDFPVRFSVLSTAPNKYTVIDPDGSIGPQACVDIVVRHTLPISANCNVTDKFRVTMQDHSTRQVLGKRDVESKLLQGEPDNNSNDGGDNFQALPHTDRPREQATSQYQYSVRSSTHRFTPPHTPNYIVLIAAIVSIIFLVLPVTPDVETRKPSVLPTYLHTTHNYQLVFAFLLGVVAMIVVRP